MTPSVPPCARRRAAIAAPGTEFDVVDIGDRYPLTNNQWLFFKQSCTGPTIDCAIEAERQGYDAVFISCNLDIGLYECRQLCTIPITATLEAAASVAFAACARRWARRVLLSWPSDRNVPRIRRELQYWDHGFGEKVLHGSGAHARINVVLPVVESHGGYLCA